MKGAELVQTVAFCTTRLRMRLSDEPSTATVITPRRAPFPSCVLTPWNFMLKFTLYRLVPKSCKQKGVATLSRSNVRAVNAAGLEQAKRLQQVRRPLAPVNVPGTCGSRTPNGEGPAALRAERYTGNLLARSKPWPSRNTRSYRAGDPHETFLPQLAFGTSATLP